MKHKLFIITLALSLLVLAGCGAAEPEQPVEAEAGGGVSVTDMLGREVLLTAPAGKVVVLAAADCEIVYALGAGSTLVGRGEYCDYPAEAAGLPLVLSGQEINAEQVIALQPDLVIMSDFEQSPERIAALEGAGIPVAVTDAHSLAGVYEAIALIGALLGREAEATDLASSMAEELAAIAAQAPDESEYSVYFETSPLEYGLWAAGSHTFQHELALMLGVENIFADLENWSMVSEEQVIDRDPSHIVTVAMYFGDGPTPEQEIMSRPGWRDIAAVKNNRVLCLDSDTISRPGPRLTQAAQDLYNFFYGE